MKLSILKGGTSRKLLWHALTFHSIRTDSQLQFTWQPLHNLHRLQTHTEHLPDQPQNILRIIPLIRNIRDTALDVGLDTLLVNDLVERHEVGVDGHVSGSGR